MSLKSKLRIDDVGMFLAFVFYTIVGIVCFVGLPLTGFPPHIAIVGILSLITAYGVFNHRTWALWAIGMLLLIVTTFSTYTLYYLLGKNLLLDISIIIYLFLTWAFTAYIASRRKTLES